MAAILPDSRLFPQVPANAASWAPIYLEPMVGSGECITVAIAAISQTGFHVELAVRPKTLRCMYGERGELVLSIAELMQETLQEHLALGGQLSDWVPPVTSCSVGPIRPAIGESVEAIARHGARLTASLSGWGIEDSESPQDLTGVGPDVDRWLQQIRASVKAKTEALDTRFNGEVYARPGALPTKIGYLGDRLAANFDALVPGPSLSTKRIRSKARLVDLQILRDQVDLNFKRISYELMLWIPEKNSPAYPKKFLDSAEAALSELTEFGDKHQLIVRPLHSADEAAARILSVEKAA